MSQENEPQAAHIDYNWEDARTHFIAFMPLDIEGMKLTVWPTKGEGIIVFIPQYTIMLVPGTTIHGGGFKTDVSTMNRRLHFYVYIGGDGPTQRQNLYHTEDRTPMCDIYKLSTSSVTETRKSKRNRHRGVD